MGRAEAVVVHGGLLQLGLGEGHRGGLALGQQQGHTCAAKHEQVKALAQAVHHQSALDGDQGQGHAAVEVQVPDQVLAHVLFGGEQHGAAAHGAAHPRAAVGAGGAGQGALAPGRQGIGDHARSKWSSKLHPLERL